MKRRKNQQQQMIISIRDIIARNHEMTTIINHITIRTIILP